MQVPADHEYQEAVQNPKQAFNDVDLGSGRPELMSIVLPIPKPRSGNFATVYRLQNGSKSWAVRCFTRSIHEDQRFRYDAISRHLSSTNLSYFAGFKFLQEGIKIRKGWFPIVKMEWIQGVSLKSYVENNLENPSNLTSLAYKWFKLISNLRQFKIAHGDLQHENVMVVDKDLRLIDYDGMWVPEVSGCASHEKGHPNYQHPLRDENFFNQDLDVFSHNAIFLTLVALITDPALWTRFRGGDECLLFRQADFCSPKTSKLFQTLEGSRMGWVKMHAAILRHLLRRPLSQCELFESFPWELALSKEQEASKLAGASPGGSWLKDYV